ncbi:MAG: 2-polyprenyl-3-methyl-6-methoxy-1,4-benzoquinone monooxygenase [Pseudomonadota bacterium]|nr:2-polyprenyl-3-methyl-6-methoxy-1,4-benzoquinone monooxygenase [Pseudomonadota bacterium]|tara:strand:+ start:998 stop:1645 length:648 start_codon:yes stop_codon:yes gene_type:complete
MEKRQYSRLDNIIIRIDAVLGESSTLQSEHTKREYPGKLVSESNLNEREKKHVSGLMRVNHAGEISAQALYKAQALTAIDNELRETMKKSADEEIDHLDWCERRLDELGGHTSYLSPIWYLGSFGIGLLAGCFGDKLNLGFIAETEHQVVGHLGSHIEQLPEHDERSRVILEQMREDELHHATTAETNGAENLPKEVKHLMTLVSKIMTKIAYHI